MHVSYCSVPSTTAASAVAATAPASTCVTVCFFMCTRDHPTAGKAGMRLSLIHISEPTRRTPISYAVFCLKKKKKQKKKKINTKTQHKKKKKKKKTKKYKKKK